MRGEGGGGGRARAEVEEQGKRVEPIMYYMLTFYFLIRFDFEFPL